MFKKPLLIIALTACATSSFAFSPFTIYGAKAKEPHHTAASKKAIHDLTHFTDFSGTWVGQCANSDGDDVDMDTVTIKNDAMEISFDGEVYAIGGLKTTSHSQQWTTDFDHEALYWNDEQTQLVFNGTWVIKSHIADSPYVAPQLFTNIANMNLSIENDNLQVRGSVLIFAGTKQEHTQDILCTYKKEVN